jgi:hypothetical protein
MADNATAGSGVFDKAWRAWLASGPDRMAVFGTPLTDTELVVIGAVLAKVREGERWCGVLDDIHDIAEVLLAHVMHTKAEPRRLAEVAAANADARRSLTVALPPSAVGARVYQNGRLIGERRVPAPPDDSDTVPTAAECAASQAGMVKLDLWGTNDASERASVRDAAHVHNVLGAISGAAGS